MRESRPIARSSFPKTRSQNGVQTSPRTRVIRLRNFIWLIALFGIVGTLLIGGTPHMLFRYSYQGSTDRMTACTYIGLHSRTIGAVDGRCPLIVLLKAR